MSPARRDPARTGRVLVVDDEPAEREGLARMVGQWGDEVETAAAGEEALALIETHHPAAMRQGAFDYLTKPVATPPDCRSCSRSPSSRSRSRGRSASCATSCGRRGPSASWSVNPRACRRSTAGSSWPPPAPPRCWSTARPAPARSWSPARSTSSPATATTERRLGCFELADAGTLFLDEIAEMDNSTQAKLLRVLPEGSLRRVGGGTHEVQVDVRVIAATNRVPQEAMAAGQLREDLFYRLNVFSIRLPALRERKEDIPILARAFVEEFNRQDNRQVRSLTPEAEKALERYAWPGNVRERRNVIQRAVVLSGTGPIGVEHLPENVLQTAESGRAERKGSVTPIREMERELILRALEETRQDKRRAAALLGISLRTLYNKLAKYGIQAVKSARVT